MSGPPQGSRQAGSAYLLALLVLTVLTGLGIALSRVASMERQLGANLLSGLQAMNSAESGLTVAETRLVEADRQEAIEFVFGVEPVMGVFRRGSRVVVEDVVLVAVAPCDLCDLGQPPRFQRVDYSVVSSGESRIWRSGESPDAGRLLGSFSIEATLTLQPWPLDEGPPTEGTSEGEE